jgi:putative transposase
VVALEWIEMCLPVIRTWRSPNGRLITFVSEGNHSGVPLQSPRSMPYSEVEEFLNGRDAARPMRREHHLASDVYTDPGYAFFLTLCARRHVEPFRNQPLAAAVVEAIEHRRKRRLWKVYGYCLMPDHLHVVVQITSDRSLYDVVAQFKSITTRASWSHGFNGSLWQHDHYDRVLRGDGEFRTRCQYALDNPVRKEWVAHWTEWPYAGTPDEW